MIFTSVCNETVHLQFANLYLGTIFRHTVNVKFFWRKFSNDLCSGAAVIILRILHLRWEFFLGNNCRTIYCLATTIILLWILHCNWDFSDVLFFITVCWSFNFHISFTNLLHCSLHIHLLRFTFANLLAFFYTCIVFDLLLQIFQVWKCFYCAVHAGFLFKGRFCSRTANATKGGSEYL